MQLISVVLGIAYLSIPAIGTTGTEMPNTKTYLVAQGEDSQPKCSNTAELEPFEEDGKFGFKNKAGDTIVSARYVAANCFLETGIASVADEKSWAYIDRHARVIIRPFVFANGPDYFAEGLARFVKNGKMGFFDTKGQVVIDARFEWVEPFSNGRARFCKGCRKQVMGEHWTMSGGVWGVIDNRGNVLHTSQ